MSNRTSVERPHVQHVQHMAKGVCTKMARLSRRSWMGRMEAFGGNSKEK